MAPLAWVAYLTARSLPLSRAAVALWILYPVWAAVPEALSVGASAALAGDRLAARLAAMPVIVALFVVSAAARSLAEDVRHRTLAAVMARPVAPWQLLTGKLVGLVAAAAAAFAVATGIAALVALVAGGPRQLPSLPVAEVLRILPVAWLWGAVALGASCVSRRLAWVGGVLGVLYLGSVLPLEPAVHTAWQAVRAALWAVAPVRVEPTPGRVALELAVAAENLGYGALALALGSAVLARRDVPTRP